MCKVQRLLGNGVAGDSLRVFGKEGEQPNERTGAFRIARMHITSVHKRVG